MIQSPRSRPGATTVQRGGPSRPGAQARAGGVARSGASPSPRGRGFTALLRLSQAAATETATGGLPGAGRPLRAPRGPRSVTAGLWNSGRRRRRHHLPRPGRLPWAQGAVRAAASVARRALPDDRVPERPGTAAPSAVLASTYSRDTGWGDTGFPGHRGTHFSWNWRNPGLTWGLAFSREVVAKGEVGR